MKQLISFKQITLLLLVVFGLSYGLVRMIYVNGFNTILGNQAAEDQLFSFAQSHSINSFILYNLHQIDFATQSQSLRSFLSRCRQNGIVEVAASGENFNKFQNKIVPFNQGGTVQNEKFSSINLEFEFWNNNTVSDGNYLCETYLKPNNLSCDTSGAFKYYRKMIGRLDSLCAAENLLFETYIGWPTAWQSMIIAQNLDRVLVHAYVSNPNNAFNYTKNRLQYLGESGKKVEFRPIFSGESDFSGNFIQTYGMDSLNHFYENSFNALAPTAWKDSLNFTGTCWFTYSYLLDAPSQISTVEKQAEILTASPNPFNPNTQISYRSDYAEFVRIAVYNTTGVHVATIYEGNLSAGNHEFNFDAQKLSSGIYFVKLLGTNRNLAKKIMLCK